MDMSSRTARNGRSFAHRPRFVLSRSHRSKTPERVYCRTRRVCVSQLQQTLPFPNNQRKPNSAMVSDTPPTETLEALYRQVAFIGGVPYEDVLDKIHKDEGIRGYLRMRGFDLDTGEIKLRKAQPTVESFVCLKEPSNGWSDSDKEMLKLGILTHDDFRTLVFDDDMQNMDSAFYLVKNLVVPLYVPNHPELSDDQTIPLAIVLLDPHVADKVLKTSHAAILDSADVVIPFAVSTKESRREERIEWSFSLGIRACEPYNTPLIRAGVFIDNDQWKLYLFDDAQQSRDKGPGRFTENSKSGKPDVIIFLQWLLNWQFQSVIDPPTAKEMLKNHPFKEDGNKVAGAEA